MKKLYDKASAVIQRIIILDVLFLQLSVSLGLINSANIPFNRFYFGFAYVHCYSYAALVIYLLHTLSKKKNLSSLMLLLQGVGVISSVLLFLHRVRGFSGAPVFITFFIYPFLISVGICVFILLIKNLFPFDRKKSSEKT